MQQQGWGEIGQQPIAMNTSSMCHLPPVISPFINGSESEHLAALEIAASVNEEVQKANAAPRSAHR